MSASTLLVQCVGPMQSWGTRSRFGERDTERAPTKSGICGLLACAQGRPRDVSIDDLAALFMAVRIDRPGHVESDYQTAGGGRWPNPERPYGVAKASGASAETVLSTRYYLADAAFLVALGGERALLEELQQALRSPRWPLFLGRRGFPPGLPPNVPDGVVDQDPITALRLHRWPLAPDGAPVPMLAAEVECRPGENGDIRRDVPISFESSARRHGERRVRRVRLAPLES